eukprot:8440999-Karenia_brevis.AAC.1
MSDMQSLASSCGQAVEANDTSSSSMVGIRACGVTALSLAQNAGIHGSTVGRLIRQFIALKTVSSSTR